MKFCGCFAGSQRTGYDSAQPERLPDYPATRIKHRRVQVNAVELRSAIDEVGYTGGIGTIPYVGWVGLCYGGVVCPRERSKVVPWNRALSGHVTFFVKGMQFGTRKRGVGRECVIP